MSRFRQISDDIRAFLQGEDQRLTDRLTMLAGEYAAGCREANERLRRCMERIEQGLRAEAVQLAEADPPLMELVTELDLAEMQPAWDEICSTYDLPKADPLRLEFAEAVNEAYAELEPLNALLGRHRRLALARAPLSMRIDVLRELAAADPSTTFWDEDLRAFERARLREVAAEARAAAQTGEVDRLKGIVEELSRPDWREPPGADLQRLVRSLGSQVSRQTARRELEALEPGLHAAFASLDIAAARQARDKWSDAARRANLSDEDPLAGRVAPVLGWVSDEDTREEQDRAFRRSVAELENAVEDDAASLAELDRRAHAAARFDRELPPAVVAAFRNRRAGLEAAERRRRFMIGAGAVTGVAAVALLVGAVLWQARAAQAATQLSGEVNRLVDEGKLAEARRLFDENRDLSTGEAWLTARRNLEEAERADAQRSSAYLAAVEAASAAGDPEVAEPHLKIARDAARSPDEKLKVARLERTWQERRDAAFSEGEARFRTAADAAAEVLTRLDEALRTAELPTIERQLADAEAAVAGLGPLAAKAREAAARERDLLNTRLAALRSAVTDLRDQRRAFDEITASLRPGGDPVAGVDRYVGALEAYRTRFPKEPRSSEFGEAISEAHLWKGAVAWRAATNGWKDLRPETMGTVAQRAAALERFLAVHPVAPDGALARRCAAFFRSIAAREEVNERLLALFKAPVVAGPLHFLRTRDGKTYYLTAAKDFSGTTAATFTFSVGTDIRRQTRSRLVSRDQLLGLSTTVAPQVAIAEAVRADLPRRSVADWDEYVIELAARVFAADQIDPVLRHLLLSEVLSAASEGNDLLAAALADARSRLEDEEIDPAAKWIDPDDADAALSRERAAAALRRLSAADFGSALEAAQEAEAGLARDVATGHRLVGWLRRDGDRWTCTGPDEPREEMTVSVGIPKGEDAGWETVGAFGPAGARLLGGELKQGRLVFAVEKAVDGPAARIGSGDE